MKESRVLGESGGKRLKKVFELGEYKGAKYLEISEYFLKDSDWQKKKAVTLNRETYGELTRVVSEHNEKIMDWIGKSYVPEDVEQYAKVQAEAVLHNRYAPCELIIETYNEPRDLSFYHVESRGRIEVVRLNLAHPTGEILSKQKKANQKLVSTILLTLFKAQSNFKGQRAFSPESLFEQLNSEWSRFLGAALREQE